MAHDAHDVGLISLFIDGVAHGFAVNGEAFVLFPIELVPALQGAVEVKGIDADKDITDDVLAWDEIAAVFVAAAEALPGLGAKAFSPIRDSAVSTHATEDSPGCDGQDRGKLMASTLSATGVWDIGKEVG